MTNTDTTCTCTSYMTRIPGEPHIPAMLELEPNPDCPEHGYPEPCTTPTRVFYGEGELACSRPALHGGPHAHSEPQGDGTIRVRTWGDGSGTGWTVLAGDDEQFCAVCAAPSPWLTEGRCTSCKCDAEWSAGYADGTVFVAKGRAYTRRKQSGAFGDAQLTVVLADGTTYGPDSRTWDLGAVSVMARPQMPDNATLQWGDR